MRLPRGTVSAPALPHSRGGQAAPEDRRATGTPGWRCSTRSAPPCHPALVGVGRRGLVPRSVPTITAILGVPHVSACKFCGGEPCRGCPMLSAHLSPLTEDGAWGAWGPWSGCGGCGGQAVRTRSCSSPPARFGGLSCAGEARQSRPCPWATSTCPGEAAGSWGHGPLTAISVSTPLPSPLHTAAPCRVCWRSGGLHLWQAVSPLLRGPAGGHCLHGHPPLPARLRLSPWAAAAGRRLRVPGALPLCMGCVLGTHAGWWSGCAGCNGVMGMGYRMKWDFRDGVQTAMGWWSCSVGCIGVAEMGCRDGVCGVMGLQAGGVWCCGMAGMACRVQGDDWDCTQHAWMGCRMLWNGRGGCRVVWMGCRVLWGCKGEVQDTVGLWGWGTACSRVARIAYEVL